MKRPLIGNWVEEGEKIIRVLLQYDLLVDPETVSISRKEDEYKVSAKGGQSSEDITRKDIEDYLEADTVEKRLSAKDNIVKKIAKAVNQLE